MKISAFTFLRNARQLGYPFIESIKSALPLVDEFVIAVGASQDDTLESVRAIGSPKIKVIETNWNEKMSGAGRIKGFVYGQQKTIALFNCTGDWAMYLEGDELIHEDDIPRIRAAMERHLDNPKVEALYFNYVHFYGNGGTRVDCPGWYRREIRVVRNTIPLWGPKGLFFLVPVTYKRSRYPRAAFADATIYHYGWVRSEEQFNTKSKQIEKLWNRQAREYHFDEIDARILKPFEGTHPAAIKDWLPPYDGLFKTNPNHKPTRRERHWHLLGIIEKILHHDFSRRHFIYAD